MGVGSLYFLFEVFLFGGRGWVVNLVLEFKSKKIFGQKKRFPEWGFGFFWKNLIKFIHVN
jgi:hypothetical protein